MRISKAFALLAVCIFVLTSCSNYDYVSKEEQAYQEEISYEAGFSDGIEFCATDYVMQQTSFWRMKTIML